MTRFQQRRGRRQRAGDRASTDPFSGGGDGDDPDAIIDDFESGSLGAYGGDTGSASIIQSPVWEGSNALSVGGHNQAIVSTGGLGNYFTKGERMHVYVRKPTMGSSTRVFFRASDRSNALTIDLEKWDNFVMKTRDTGLENILDKADDVGIATSKWYRVELVQDDGTLGGPDNEIRARLVDPADNSILGRELAAPTDFQMGQTGVGFANWTQTAGGDISQFDYAYKPGPGGSAPPTNRVPDASFSYAPTKPAPDEDVSFDGSASSDPDGEIVGYEWDLTGDGTIDATGPTASRSYAEGSYPVTLTVRDDVGARISTTKTVSVSESGGTAPGEPDKVIHFDDYSTWTDDMTEFHGDDVEAVDSYGHPDPDGGTRAVQLRVPEGTHGKWDARWDYRRDSSVPAPSDVMWFQLWEWRGPENGFGNYDATNPGEEWEYGGKTPGPSDKISGNGNGGKCVNGTDGWTARRGTTMSSSTDRNNAGDGDTNDGYYLYDDNNCGNTYSRDGYFPTGQWVRVDGYVEMNTPGSSNGILRLWNDGDLVVEKTNCYFRDSGYGDRIKANEIWFNLYWGGKWTATTDLRYRWYQLKVGQERFESDLGGI